MTNERDAIAGLKMLKILSFRNLEWIVKRFFSGKGELRVV